MSSIEVTDKFVEKASFSENIINCDADPLAPGCLEVVEHRKGGMFKFDPVIAVNALFVTDWQVYDDVSGHALRRLLTNIPVLNANVLDYLLEHQELIPKEWKGKIVLFWGTIYRQRLFPKILCVRYLK